MASEHVLNYNGQTECSGERVAPHLRCSNCQDTIRRAAKKGINHYKAHGVGQTDKTRTWRRRG